MKHIDHQLQRLLKAASRVPDPSASLPVSLERQVLAQWQRQRGNGGELAVQRMLSLAMVSAGLLLMMCFVWTQYSNESRQSSEALSLVNSSIQLSLLP